MKWLAYGAWMIVWFFIQVLILYFMGRGFIPAIIGVGIGVLGFRLIRNHFKNQSKIAPILLSQLKKEPNKSFKNTTQKSDDMLTTTEDSTIISDDLYGVALAEVNKGQQILGLWARCLVKADGSMDKATAFYIKLRAEQLERESIESHEPVVEKEIADNEPSVEVDNSFTAEAIPIHQQGEAPPFNWLVLVGMFILFLGSILIFIIQITSN